MRAEGQRPPGSSRPAFLASGAAVLLASAPGRTELVGEADGAPAGLDDLSRRLWEELARRLEAGETRLYAAELEAALSAAPPALGDALQALRRANLVDWDEPGPYLYVQRPSGKPPNLLTPAEPVGPEEEVQKVFAALEWATGGTLSPLARERIREWLPVLGLRGVLDEIGLCREQGRRRFNQISLALDRACNRRKSVSPFGPLGGRGVIPVPGGAEAAPPGQAGPDPEPVPNAAAYDPVPDEAVRLWVEAHPDLYADRPQAPPASPATGARQGTWAAAYDPVPAEVVRAWVESFAEEYRDYQKEYRHLAERAKTGPFRTRRPRNR